MNRDDRLLVIPAAGRGSRLGGEKPKALVQVAGRAMLDHLLDLYEPFVFEAIVVVSPSASAAVRAHLTDRRAGPEVVLVEQATPTGMLDAILLAQPAVRTARVVRVWITWVDQVAVREETLARMAAIEAREPGASIVFPTLTKNDPYTHLQREPGGRIVAILHRREGDPMPQQGESEMGVFSVRGDAFVRDLSEFAEFVSHGAATGERNFLPFIPWMAARAPVLTFSCTEEIEAIGINTPEELARIERHLAARGR